MRLMGRAEALRAGVRTDMKTYALVEPSLTLLVWYYRHPRPSYRLPSEYQFPRPVQGGAVTRPIPGTLEASLKFEPRDLWVGAYWNVSYYFFKPRRRLDVWVCLLPCLPMRVSFDYYGGKE